MKELNFTPFPEIVTDRLLLRSLQSTDANEIFALRSDDDVNKYIGRPKAKTIEDAEQFIERILNAIQNNQSLWWAITVKPENTLAGGILLWNINKENATVEIGYELLPIYQGNRIAQEAIEAVLAFAFASLKFSAVSAVVHKDNIASLKVLQKNNFELKGETEDSMLEYILHSKNFLNV